MAEPTTFKYRAFLSYSHRDKTWGEWLHRALEGTRIDKDLVGRQTPAGPVPKTLRPIFRDRDDFSAGHSLTAQTIAALEASHFLIVICSPDAAASPYVNEEIRRFKALGRSERIIPVIIAGEPFGPARGDDTPECFPPALRFKLGPDGALTDELEEPIAADARETGDGKEIAKQKLVAGLLGLGLDEVVKRAERARRRRNRFWAALAGVFLLLAVLATGGFAWARHELSRNETLLDLTLQRATGLVSKAVSMSEQFGVPYNVSIGILEEAEGLFRDMAQLGRESPLLGYRRAWMLIQFARSYKTLGNTAAQEQRAAAARDAMLELAASNPATPEYQGLLAEAYVEVGHALLAQGKLDQALLNSRAGLPIIERVAAVSGHPYWLRILLQSHSVIGDSLVAHGQYEEAIASFQQALPLAERLAADNPEFRDDISVILTKIGDVLVELRRYDDALVIFRGSAEIAEQVAAGMKGGMEAQRGLATSHVKIADVLMLQSQPDEALKLYRDGLAIIERVAASDRSNAGWQRDLAVIQDKIGDVLLHQGKPDEALKVFRATLVIFETLAAADRINVQWQVNLVWSNWRLALLGDQPARRWTFVVDTLRKLKERNSLSDQEARWLPVAEGNLAKLQGAPQAQP